MTVVDVHTHMLSERWIELLRAHGGHYTLATVPGGQRAVHVSGAPFMTLTPGMLDYDLRIRRMDEAVVGWPACRGSIPSSPSPSWTGRWRRAPSA